MDNEEPVNRAESFEKALEEAKGARYVLRLFVAGNSPKSTEAIESIRRICETKLKGRYTLEVVDIYQQPNVARENQVIAAPMLVKELPLPLRRIIGDLSSTDRILVGLNLETIKD